MKKAWIILMTLIVSLTLAPYQIVTAQDQVGQPFKIRATCYTWTGNRCANGDYPVEGLSVAGKRSWLGKSLAIYEVAKDGSVGDFIGFFEFTDTGYGITKTNSKGEKYGTIQAGESIDIYRDTLDGCYEWIDKYSDYVYIQVIDAKG
jgi:hypothetical protein